MITDEYDIDKTIAEGYFAKIFLTNHKPTKSCVVLKACHMELTNVKEFIKEFHYNYQLSHHPHILSCYQVNSWRCTTWFADNDWEVYKMLMTTFCRSSFKQVIIMFSQWNTLLMATYRRMLVSDYKAVIKWMVFYVYLIYNFFH